MVKAAWSPLLVDCPARLAVEILADKWTALVVFALRTGPLRHGELVDAVGGISRKVLTENLRRLQGYGLVERLEPTPRRIRYRLTSLGRTLVVPITALNEWASANAGSITAFQDEANAKEALGAA